MNLSRIKKNRISRMVNLFLFGITSQDERTPEQLREHYEVEKKLANKLRNSSKEERRYLYSTIYDELYRQVPYHPQLTQKGSDFRSISVSKQMVLLGRFLNPNFRFLEIGSGDCRLSFEVAKHVKTIYAIDVSEEITKCEHNTSPKNFELIISDGCSIPVPENSINLAYSKDLLEHLHPDDAFDQLQNIFKALTCGGKYICITPNRLSGPHDISKYFDTVATGFHLKEYTVTDLSELFAKVGFSKISTYVGGEGLYIKFPSLLIRLFERLLSILPFCLRQRISTMLPVKGLLGIIIVGTK